MFGVVFLSSLLVLTVRGELLSHNQIGKVSKLFITILIF